MLECLLFTGCSISGSSYHLGTLSDVTLSSSDLWFLIQEGSEADRTPAPLGISTASGITFSKGHFWVRVRWYHGCSSVCPCVVFLCPDGGVEQVFPLRLPILMICSAEWVTNEGWVHCCDPVVWGSVCQQSRGQSLADSPESWFPKPFSWCDDHWITEFKFTSIWFSTHYLSGISPQGYIIKTFVFERRHVLLFLVFLSSMFFVSVVKGAPLPLNPLKSLLVAQPILLHHRDTFA